MGFGGRDVYGSMLFALSLLCSLHMYRKLAKRPSFPAPPAHSKLSSNHYYTSFGSIKTHRRAEMKSDTSDSNLQASIHNPDFLRKQARWIRDELDPQVARDGPDALHSDEILRLDEFLRRLLASDVRLEDIRVSRLHLAISGISGRATRWPKKLIDKSDILRAAWEAEHGPLSQLVPPLYEPGGRLHGICKPEDLSKEKLIIKWLKSPGVKLSPLLARRVGDLGFKAGE